MSEEKTEDATDKKKSDLRKKGSSARSMDAGMAAGTIALLVVLPTLAGTMFSSLRVSMERAFELSATLDQTQAMALLREELVGVAQAVAVPLLTIAAAGVLGQAAVTRSKPNPFTLKPKFDAVNPKQGIKRVFSLNSLVEAGKGAAKIAVVVAAAYGIWKSSLATIISSSDTIEGFMSAAGGSVTALLTRVAVAALLVGLFDAVWQTKRFRKQSKMTKNEVKQEHKSSEGDPTFKAMRRSRQLAMGRNRMIAAVADADVIVVNPTHIAIAIKYEPGMPAPRVLAKGAGHVADRIRERAGECQIPIEQHIPVARALYANCKVGSFIPADLYDAVAHIFAAVMATKPRKAARP